METREKYKLTLSPFFIRAVNDPNREYPGMVNDRPQELSPEEKMKKYGPQALAFAELMAVMLDASASAPEDVFKMSSRIMKEYGDMSIMSVNDPQKLAEHFDVPLSRALQVVACAELGRRFYKKNEASAPTVRTAADVFEYVKNMYSLPKEHLRGLYLNAHYKIIHDEIISIGTIDTNIVHPREVFRPALEYAAAAVILVHNHPSGVTDPSDADLAITSQLVRAGKLMGIELVDHIIVTKNSFASIPADYSK